MYFINRFLYTIILSLLVSSLVLSQEIRIIVENPGITNTISDSVLVRDINSDICSHAIIKSDIPGIRFYTNLGIEKVNSDTSGYRIWFPSQASSLKIIVPGFPLYDFPLEKKKDPVTYIMILQVVKNEKVIVYKADTIKKLTIYTFPVSARASSGDIGLGRTPLFLDESQIPDHSDIKLHRYGFYGEEVWSDSLRLNGNYNAYLKRYSERRRFYIMATAGILKGFGRGVFGIQAGQMGKFGYYLSGKMTFKGGSDSGPDYGSSYAVTGGLNKSVGILNLYIGAGYCANNEIYYYRGESRVGKGFLADFGLIMNVNPKLLVSFNSNIRKGDEFEFDYVPFDYSFGLGWSF
jgi:hypothetical protein